MPHNNSKSALQKFFEELKVSANSALALDYDGTLAPFRVDRNAAFPYPGVRQVLGRIIETGQTRVVLISGRLAEEVRDLLGIQPAPEIWGVHGRQRLWPSGRCELMPAKASDQEALNKAKSWVENSNYAELTEFKPGSIALHWRVLSKNEILVASNAIRAALAPIADQAHMSLLEFDGGIELRPMEPNKGTAALTLFKELAAKTPFAYLGDDTTDEDAFLALRETGAMRVLVRPQWRETAADIWIRPPEELLEFLHAWAEYCEGKR